MTMICYDFLGARQVFFSNVGLNIHVFYFKRKRITNKPKAYEWLSRRKNKQYNNFSNVRTDFNLT